MIRSVEGWRHFRAAESAYDRIGSEPAACDWTIFDRRVGAARELAVRDGDSHLVAACLELQASRWELAGLQGEALAALGGALHAYGLLVDPQQRSLHCARVKVRVDNWFQIPRVFVSYARENRRRVLNIVRFLKSPPRGVEVVWEDDFIPGVDIAHLARWLIDGVSAPTRNDVTGLVSDAMRVAGIYMVMWSRSFARRPWTTWELAVVREQLDSRRRRGEVGPRVVFVRLDEHPMPARYRDNLWVDLSRGWTPRARSELVRAVRATEFLGVRTGQQP